MLGCCSRDKNEGTHTYDTVGSGEECPRSDPGGPEVRTGGGWRSRAELCAKIILLYPGVHVMGRAEIRFHTSTCTDTAFHCGDERRKNQGAGSSKQQQQQPAASVSLMLLLLGAGSVDCGLLWSNCCTTGVVFMDQSDAFFLRCSRVPVEVIVRTGRMFSACYM